MSCQDFVIKLFICTISLLHGITVLHVLGMPKNNVELVLKRVCQVMMCGVVLSTLIYFITFY